MEQRAETGALVYFQYAAVLSLVIASACGGNIDANLSDDSMGGSGGGGSGGGPTEPASGGSGGLATGGSEPYIEPECPDEDPPPTFRECDPLDPLADCAEGLGCYPYLEYPFGERCGQPTFGAICALAGTGEQGDFCGEGEDPCAPGKLCVVGAAGGKRCGQVCEPIAEHGCPAGLVCGETDIQGYGVCF